MSSQWLELITQRRTQYALGRNASIDKAATSELIKKAIKLAPSSFNSQSSRAVILYGEQSVKFWNLVKQELAKLISGDALVATSAKLDSFAAGLGTVLFFEDQDTVKGLQEKFALYADNFPVWSEQSSGMAQFAVWVALREAGLGASLQHYNPVVDAAAAAEWNIPSSWKLRAQMPFGSNEAPFGEKAFIDDADRFIEAG
ncbi:nitroreductase family protein [Frateuria aurantia]